MKAPVYSYKFDTIDKSGRVQVTCDGVAFAEVQTLKTAAWLVSRLEAADSMADPAAEIAALRERVEVLEGLVMRYQAHHDNKESPLRCFCLLCEEAKAALKGAK